MRNTEKLPGRAAPKERPSSDEIRHFVMSTDGGDGEGLEDLFQVQSKDSTRLTQVAPDNHAANAVGILCGQFCWRGGVVNSAEATVAAGAEPAKYVIARTGRNAVNIHLLKYYVTFIFSYIHVYFCT